MVINTDLGNFISNTCPCRTSSSTWTSVCHRNVLLLQSPLLRLLSESNGLLRLAAQLSLLVCLGALHALSTVRPEKSALATSPLVVGTASLLAPS